MSKVLYISETTVQNTPNSYTHGVLRVLIVSNRLFQRDGASVGVDVEELLGSLIPIDTVCDGVLK